jgi:hypothetical protein
MAPPVPQALNRAHQHPNYLQRGKRAKGAQGGGILGTGTCSEICRPEIDIMGVKRMAPYLVELSSNRPKHNHVIPKESAVERDR